MILDVTQVVLLLICTGLLTFVCHRLTSHRAQPANIKQEETPKDLPEPDIQEIREEFIAYIGRESSDLKLDHLGRHPQHIDYFCGYERFKIWINIWIGTDLDRIATNLMISKEYMETFERLKGNKHKIEWLFPEEEIKCDLIGDNHRIGVQKDINLSQRENWHEISIWARGNLEKLFWVISIHDKLSSDDTQTLDTPFSPKLG